MPTRCHRHRDWWQVWCCCSDLLAFPRASALLPCQFGFAQQPNQPGSALCAVEACADPASIDAERAWKLWLFLPRMLLHRPGGVARLPKPTLRARFQALFRGDWPALVDEATSGIAPRQLLPPHTSNDSRADRAVHLAHFGELSAARHALLAEPLAPGDESTLHRLHDLARRPAAV